ncbi:cyanophycinase [Roseateles cavernae]|uniref:cyanophycinase n=1 Tax=Roseateles cavernae TaxID=3153578 RepID=UPI0032E435FD
MNNTKLTTRRAWLGLMRGLMALALLAGATTLVQAAGGGNKGGATPTTSTKAYDYYLTGQAADMQPAAPATPMLVLMGGGLDVDSAFEAMIAKARGNAGGKIDIVIIRASGADGYNDYLYQMAPDGVDSVETLVIKSRDGANNAEVNRIVAGADLLFIGGGDQWNYINLWKGTALDTTLQGLAARKVPFGGTSAGLAVLGQIDFSAQYDTITSSQAMNNPYDRKVALDRGFVTGLRGLANTITDAHLVTRDRMGRLMTFLARIIADGWVGAAEQARGIGVDEATAVVVDDGIASVQGSGAAYFLQPAIAATTIKPKTPLTFRNVRVDRLRAQQGSFNLLNWTPGSGATPYSLSVEAGVLTSSGSNGSPY